MATYPVYGTIDDADAYWTAHAAPSTWTTAWSSVSTANKTFALRMASEALDAMYGTRWVGTRATSSQVRDWPRINGEDSDGNALSSDTTPQAIEDATYYLALAHANGETLVPDVAAGSNVIRKRTKVGEIETDVEYTGQKQTERTYSKVDAMLRGRGLIAGRGVLVRA